MPVLRSRRSILGVLLAAGLAAAAAVAPSVAAGSTRVVGAGGGSGACADPDHPTIGGAVAAAGAGDTILVCPGRYREAVTISGHGKDGLTIRGMSPWTASLESPALTTAGQLQLLVIDGADDVTVRGLRFGAATASPCTVVTSFLAISSAQHAVIRGNRFRALGSDTTGACGYLTAVNVGHGSSAWIGYNLIRDFKGLGVGSSGRSTITHNSFRAWHIGEDESASGGFAAILASYGPVRVTANRIVGRESAGLSTPLLTIGISLDGGSTTGVIRGNLIRNAGLGIRLFEIINAGSGVVRIRDNEVHDNRYEGMWIAQKGFTGSRITGNDFRGNGGIDCSDGSGGSVATWTDNLGDDADVAGICSPGVLVP